MYDFSTSDLNLAAYVLSHNGRLNQVDRSHGRRAVLELSVPEDPEQLKQQFWNNTPVPVLDFTSSVAQVKRRLYSDGTLSTRV